MPGFQHNKQEDWQKRKIASSGKFLKAPRTTMTDQVMAQSLKLKFPASNHYKNAHKSTVGDGIKKAKSGDKDFRLVQTISEALWKGAQTPDHKYNPNYSLT